MEYTQELEDKWVAALRSGNWKQGTWSLKNGDKYCCLGVLYEIAGGKWDSYKGIGWAHNSTTQVPCELMDNETQDILSKMNDELGASFDDIADYIKHTSLAKGPKA